MIRDELVDCLRGKVGKPISMRCVGGTLIGNFEKFIWDGEVPMLTGVKIDTFGKPFEPADIIEIKDASSCELAKLKLDALLI